MIFAYISCHAVAIIEKITNLHEKGRLVTSSLYFPFFWLLLFLENDGARCQVQQTNAVKKYLVRSLTVRQRNLEDSIQ